MGGGSVDRLLGLFVCSGVEVEQQEEMSRPDELKLTAWSPG